MSETDIGNAAGAGEAPATDDGAEDGKHFWGSIRGVITAVSGLVVALAGLITVLGNVGLFGGKAGGEGEGEEKTGPLALETPAPTPIATSSPTATAAPLAANEPAPAQADVRMFRVSSPSDGWVAIRARATVSSEMLGRLENGSFVRCGRQTPDTTGIDHRFWRYCPEVRGYMAERLLRRADD
ncbi:hypothetical protein [Qipengyuania mesophila]|uniref:hypothetical protein n=1 Tax=Qipengyuania mesophila TaxID=2867246 RepID=UPI003513F05D